MIAAAAGLLVGATVVTAEVEEKAELVAALTAWNLVDEEFDVGGVVVMDGPDNRLAGVQPVHYHMAWIHQTRLGSHLLGF